MPGNGGQFCGRKLSLVRNSYKPLTEDSRPQAGLCIPEGRLLAERACGDRTIHVGTKSEADMPLIEDLRPILGLSSPKLMYELDITDVGDWA